MNRARPGAAKDRIGTSNQFWQLFRISDHRAERGEPSCHRGLVVEFVDRPPTFAVCVRGASLAPRDAALAAPGTTKKPASADRSMRPGLGPISTLS